jgi:ATPase involved in DNA replication initiation
MLSPSQSANYSMHTKKDNNATSPAPSPRPLPEPRPLPRMQLGLPVLQEGPGSRQTPDQSWRFSFDDFVVGPCNELAYAASRSMCEDMLYTDVLYLSSATGLGKTHLMQAVGKTLCSCCNRRNMRVEYVMAEEFANQFYQALKSQSMDSFKARYRSVDLFLMEDVHFLQGKEKMQAELLATVNALSERGSKVVFTSSFMPKDLKQLDEQLQSRMNSGLLAVIERPDEPLRRKILRHKAASQHVSLSEEVEDALARHINKDVRQLESCLQNLILKARLLNTNISLQMAFEVMSHYAALNPVLDMETILSFVCRAFRLDREQLLSASRKQDYVQARNTAFFLARKHTDLSLEAIGRQFNRRHSTVLKGITSLEREISRQSPLGRQIANTISVIEKNGNILG